MSLSNPDEALLARNPTMRRSIDSGRRTALQAGAALGANHAVSRTAVAAGGGEPAPQAPEPFTRLHVDDAQALIGIARSGSVWRLSGSGWRRVGSTADADAPPASGVGLTVGRASNGGIWTLDGDRFETSGPLQLALHAGMQVLPDGIVAVAQESGGRQVAVRLERDARSSWREVARGSDPVLPDAVPVQFDPDGTASDSDGHIAVLGAPDSQRYLHGVLGDAIEATAMLYIDRLSLETIARIDLPMPHVFEDIAPRTIAWRGRRALLTIRAGPSGGQLAVVERAAPHAPRLSIVALGEPIGTRHRWLSPITDGERIYAVHTPHIGGILHRYADDGDALRGEVLARGVTNHALGSRRLDESALFERQLVLPTQDRRAMRVFTLDAAGAVTAMRDLPSPAPVTTLHRWSRSGTPVLAALLQDGSVPMIDLPRPSAR
jgi:hypothetical protein